MGFQGLRLFPTYHGYSLGDRCAADLLSAAQAKHIPVALAIRVEDERQHHWLMKVPALDVQAVADVIGAFPRITFAISGATYGELRSVWHALEQCDNWYFDIGRMHGRHSNPGPVEVVVRAVASFGAKRMLYGSNAPFQYIKSSLLKVIHAEIEEEDRQLILSGNVLRLLAKKP
jgi:predicted TIM-barrel fold metal-dependent hydrolase